MCSTRSFPASITTHRIPRTSRSCRLSSLRGSRRAIWRSWLDRILPFRLAVGDAGVEVEKHGLAGAIVRLLGHGKIELPPARQRQIGRIADRDAFAKTRFKPAEKTVETPIGDNAERSESLSGILCVLPKIHVITERRLAECHERFSGGAQMAVFLCAGRYPASTVRISPEKSSSRQEIKH